MQAERSYRKGQKQEQKPKIKYEAMQRLPRERALAVHQPAMDRGAQCEKCPLFGLRAGPVMGDIVENAAITIIGEAPGENELTQKRPFVGRSGDILNTSLNEGGVAREDCTITNALLCRPPEELKAFEYRLRVMHEAACERAKQRGEPEPPEPVLPYEACFPRLRRDVEESKSKTVLAVGGAALRAVADVWDVPMGSSKKVKAGEIRISSLKKQIGSPLTLKDGTIVVASYHPAFAMRPGSRHYMHVVKAHLKRAAQIARRGRIDWTEPQYILNPSVEVIEETLASMQGRMKTIDIETDKGTRGDGEFDPFSCRIRCIGFGTKVDGKETVIAVPIRHMDGEEWWPPVEKKRVVQACMDALNDESEDPDTGAPSMLVGHHLAFDTSVMLRFKLLVRRNRQYEDTMLMHHDTVDNDLPHDLGFVGARYFEVPSWKSGADDKFYENVTDWDLHLYNARDVLTTMRLYETLSSEVLRYGTQMQYELDRAMAPVARDMGELGLFVDEVKRGELSLKMNQEAFSRLEKLKTIVGNPKFNPSSPHQIRKFLFVEKKHTPVINTKGKDWEDGEDPSTNTAALTKLVSQQSCDAQTKDFINTLLEYRAFMKLKGTYIDKLRVNYPDWKKEFGVDIPMVSEVKGPVWRKYKVKERVGLLPEDVQLRWRLFSKQEKKRHVDSTPEGVWEQAVVIPARPAMSRLHTTYKLHVIPSGRMSTTPAVQNWPKMGRANMHEMIIAPPGHVMVGADLDQVELRLYAAISGDKLLLEAFGKGLDPHSYNAASLFAKKLGKSIWDAYLYIVGLPDMHAFHYGKAAAEKSGLGLAVTNETVAAFNAVLKKVGGVGNTTAQAIADTMQLPLVIVEALIVGHKKGDKEKKKLRGYAKTFAYLETYGGEAEKLYGYMSTARDKGTGALMFPDLLESDVKEWHDEWHKNHPETKAWQEACQRVARMEGFTAAPLGCYRKRFFPGGPNKPGATFNHVIQGAAAEIANAALLKIAEQIPFGCWSPFTGVCLQVHDYLGCFVPVEYAERTKVIIEEALCTEIFNGVKITASAVISGGLATQ